MLPSSPRRTTRSTAAVSAETQSPSPRPSKEPPFAAGSVDFSALPGRRSQLLDLQRILGPAGSPTLPLLLHGGAATGKTSSVLLLLTSLRLRFAYASARSARSARALFHTILSQLPPTRLASNFDKPPEFVAALREALLDICADGEMFYLVFDNLELVRLWEKGGTVITFLLRLRDLLQMPRVGFIYISRVTPDAFYGMYGSIEPLSVYFPDYTVEELRDIFVSRNQVNRKLYLSFLSVVLKPFSRVTRRVDLLATALEPLFERYREPLADRNAVPDEAMRRRLYDYVQPHLAAALNETFVVPVMCSSDDGKNVDPKKPANRNFGTGKDGLGGLNFHMSLSAKYLLLSAFLASRNPATLDAALFDSTGGLDDRKRKRKSSQSSLDKKEAAVQEILIKGPGTFPLERLLAVYQCIASVWDDDPQECSFGSSATDASKIGIMADVLLELSTLCNSNFLIKIGSCPLEGSIRYRSAIDEDLALKIARSVNFPLSKYIYRR